MQLTPLSQRDKQWGDITIGNSNSKLKDVGCTLTALSMLAGTTPDVLNAKLTAVNGFQDDKIIWTAINKTDLLIRFPDMGRHYSYDNDAVSEAINKYGGCLVEVDYDGVTSTPSDRHWILYIGNGQAIDPWNGYIISTNKYPIVKGYCIIEVLDVLNDMTQEQKKVLELLESYRLSNDALKNGNLEGAVNALIGWAGDVKNLNETVSNQSKEIDGLKTSQKDLESRIEQLEADAKANNALIESYQSQVTTAKSTESKLLKQIEDIQGESSTWKNRYEAKCKETIDKYSALELLKMGLLKILGKK